MKHKIVVWGASGHALVVADILKLTGEYEIAGFIDDVTPGLLQREFCGGPVLRGQGSLHMLKQNGVSHVIIGFGNCAARLSAAKLACEMGFTLATAIHPNATIARDSIIGAGTVISAGAVVNSGATIGENVIVNTCASVDHECVIGDGVHICPGVHLAGRVHVGRGSWVGIGSSVIDRVRIGSGTMIGAGSVVVHDIPDGMLAYGVPAKVIKRVSTDE